MSPDLRWRDGILDAYADVYMPAVLDALGALAPLAPLAPLDRVRRDVMADRIRRRRQRARDREPIAFLGPNTLVPGTSILVRDAREGRFEGDDIPADLRRQWIQGTGPAARPRATVDEGLRSVAYALLSGADGWMFDGEDAYMRAYEDRVRRAVNTPDRRGRCALWQGGMEAQIPVGSARGVEVAMRKAVAGAEREQREGASGKWVAHWKMVHIVRPVWELAGEDNQAGRAFPPLTHTLADAAALTALELAPRTVRGARDLLSVGLQYGNAFSRGYQAAALKPADSFGDDDILYLMEDMATGEIRLSILWEWLAKGASFTEDDPETGTRAGEALTSALFRRLLDEEHAKLIAAADHDVHDDSKRTTLPITRAIVEAYVPAPIKPPWYVDLLNLNLGNHDPDVAQERVDAYLAAFERDGTRITANLDFDRPTGTMPAEAAPRTETQPARSPT